MGGHLRFESLKTINLFSWNDGDLIAIIDGDAEMSMRIREMGNNSAVRANWHPNTNIWTSSFISTVIRDPIIQLHK